MSTSDNSPTLTLVHSAFGPQSSLYTILQCTQSSTPTQLKRAYHKAALRYHPDRLCCDVEHDHHEATSSSSSSTLKFQAVSAAYQLLMDDRRRSVYDATGQILEEDDTNDANDDNNASHTPFYSTSKASPSHHPQKQWEQFFQSIFHELISTGSHHATTASAYRGSREETKDVLYYYRMCKGNMAKVVECIIHGSAEDVGRWKRKIVAPALKRGEVDEYSGDCSDSGGVCGEKKKSCNGKMSSSKKQKRTILEDDSSSDEEITKVRSSSKKRGGKGKSTNNSSLIDTDEEEDDIASPQRQPSPSAANSSMSKRDKMDHRVAKKRKAKAQKEMEMADIIQSKNWDINGATKRSSQPRPPKNMGGISDALLSDMEQRYGNTKKKKKR